MGHQVIWTDEAIAEHPRLGRCLRELTVRPSRLIYDIDDQARTIQVRVLWHGARQEPRAQ